MERGTKVIQQSFFLQQIEVQPPEGINATVAAPLSPGGGWAPSIPAYTRTNKLTFNDLKLRARGGVMTGDVQKEAHMAFSLG